MEDRPQDGENRNLPEESGAAEPGREVIEAEILPAVKPLSDVERERLAELEARVDRWISDTREVGRALREIRDRELYLETHLTFAAYLRDRYDIESSQSYRIIDFAWMAETVEEVSPMGETVVPGPENERQVRELAKLAREVAREWEGKDAGKAEGEEVARRVWRSLQENLGGPPTSYRQVEAAVKAERKLIQEAKPGGEVPGASVPDPQAVLEANKDRVLGWHQGEFQELFEELDEDDLPGQGEVKLLLADPPYGVDYHTGKPLVPGGRRLKNDLTPEQAAGILTDMLQTMSYALAEHAHVVVFCAPEHEPLMRSRVEAEGFDIRSHLVWAKNTHGGGDTRNGLAPSHERAIHAIKGNPGLPGGRRPRDVLSHSRVPDTEPHPTRKPAALLRELIEALTEPGDLVADPVGGSGSTLVAAVQRRRRAWGCEYDPGYHDAGAARIAEALEGSAVTGADIGSPVADQGAESSPEAPSEKPREAHQRLTRRLYGLRDPLTDQESSTPEDAASLLPLLRAWLESKREKPRLLVEPFAFSHSQDGLMAALVEPSLAGHFLLLVGDREQEISAAWHTILAEPTAARLVESLGFLKYGFGRISTGSILAQLAYPNLTTPAGEAVASPEAREALRLLFSRRPFWIVEMANTSALGERSQWRISSEDVGAALPKHPDGGLGTLVEANIRGLFEAEAGGRIEFREAPDTDQDVGGLEALKDPQLTDDPETAFFVVPPQAVGHHEALLQLSNVDGDFLAVIEDSARARVRARERNLDLRWLGPGRIADYQPGQLLLVGRDLAWADKAVSKPPALTDEERRDLDAYYSSEDGG